MRRVRYQIYYAESVPSLPVINEQENLPALRWSSCAAPVGQILNDSICTSRSTAPANLLPDELLFYFSATSNITINLFKLRSEKTVNSADMSFWKIDSATRQQTKSRTGPCALFEIRSTSRSGESRIDFEHKKRRNANAQLDSIGQKAKKKKKTRTLPVHSYLSTTPSLFVNNLLSLRVVVCSCIKKSVVEEASETCDRCYAWLTNREMNVGILAFKTPSTQGAGRGCFRRVTNPTTDQLTHPTTRQARVVRESR